MICKRVVSAVAGALALANTGVFAAPAPSPVTSANGLVFSVVVPGGPPNARPFDLSVRLNEYNPEIGLAPYFDFYVGVDTVSPKLVGDLVSGVVYAQGTGPDGEPYNNTYALYVNTETYLGNTTVFTTGFGNTTAYAGFRDDGWELVPAFGNTYDLVHSQPAGVGSGWRLCVASFDTDYGDWSNLQYYTYTGTAEPSDYCSDVLIQTTLGW